MGRNGDDKIDGLFYRGKRERRKTENGPKTKPLVHVLHLRTTIFSVFENEEKIAFLVK
jgi:hypothetical protein